MHIPLTDIIVFARSNIFEATRRHAQQHSQISLTDLASAVLVFAALGVFLFFLSKIFSPDEKTRGLNSPWRLFWQLCQTHKLRLSDRCLLWRIARANRLQDPALIFVEPELLDVDVLGKGFAKHATAMKSLNQQLFAGVNEDSSGQ